MTIKFELTADRFKLKKFNCIWIAGPMQHSVFFADLINELIVIVPDSLSTLQNKYLFCKYFCSCMSRYHFYWMSSISRCCLLVNMKIFGYLNKVKCFYYCFFIINDHLNKLELGQRNCLLWKPLSFFYNTEVFQRLSIKQFELNDDHRDYTVRKSRHGAMSWHCIDVTFTVKRC